MEHLTIIKRLLVPHATTPSLCNMSIASIGLYIHIPFCSSICPYCSFYKIKWTEELEISFIKTLVKELKFYASHPFKKPIHSIFFGGGTPTLLSQSHWSDIVTSLYDNFDILPNCEITTEANPETISHNLLSFLPTLGINRLSVGIQSMHQHELTYLGRNHTPSALMKTLSLIQDSDFKNVNYDLIFGTSVGTSSLIQTSLDQLLAFSPTHISTYALSIEPNTPFEKKKIQPIESEEELKQYESIVSHLSLHGFNHYEVSAFALPGYESQHNLTYWTYRDFIGVGPSACSFIQGKRYTREASLTEYLKTPLPSTLIQNTPDLSQKEQMHEFIMSTLRLKQGLSLMEFQHRFNSSFYDIFSKPLETLCSTGFLTKTPSHIQTTKKGLYLLNEILLEFLD